MAEELYSDAQQLGAEQRWDEAQAVGLRAATLFRNLYRTDPSTHRRSLALILLDLGVWLDTCDMSEEAVTHSCEAVELFRHLETDDPDTYRPLVAKALSNYCIHLNHHHQYHESVQVGEEAIRLYRSLAKNDPETYASKLAMAVQSTAISANGAEDSEKAALLNADVINLYRDLYAHDKAYARQLAEVILLYVLSLDETQRMDEAHPLIEEVKSLVNEQISEGDPLKHTGQLVHLLDHLGVLSSAHDDAFDYSLKATNIAQGIRHKSPGTQSAIWANAFHNHAVNCLALQRYTEGVKAAEVALPLREDLYKRFPDTWREMVIASLFIYAACLRGMGDLSKAHAADEKAVLLLDVTGQIAVRKDKFIGRGGYGVVFEAEWIKPVPMRNFDPEPRKQKLIVKMLPGQVPDLAKSSSIARRRVMREMIIWYRLMGSTHRNIVNFAGFVTDLEGLGLLSSYYTNGSVSTFLLTHPDANREALASLSSLYIANVTNDPPFIQCADVARGLLHLHSFDPCVVHGDLKPANVVVHEDGHAALCDFGLSRLTAAVLDVSSDNHSNTSDNEVSPRSIPQYALSHGTGFTTTSFGGTPAYLAPEQIESDDPNPTPQTDVYAFSLTCGEIITSTPPFARFNSKTIARLMDSIVSREDEPYEIHSITERYPAYSVLADCWDWDQERRPGIKAVCEKLGVELN